MYKSKFIQTTKRQIVYALLFALGGCSHGLKNQSKFCRGLASGMSCEAALGIDANSSGKLNEIRALFSFAQENISGTNSFAMSTPGSRPFESSRGILSFDGSMFGDKPGEMKFVGFKGGEIYYLSSLPEQYHDQVLLLALGKKHLNLDSIEEIYNYFERKPHINTFPGSSFLIERQGTRIYIKDFYYLAETSSDFFVGTIYSPLLKDKRSSEVMPRVLELMYKNKEVLTESFLSSVYSRIARDLSFQESSKEIKWLNKNYEHLDPSKLSMNVISNSEFNSLILPANSAVYSSGIAAGYLTDKPTGEKPEIVILKPGEYLDFPKHGGYVSLGAQGQLSHGILASKASGVPVVYFPKEKIDRKLIGEPVILSGTSKFLRKTSGKTLEYIELIKKHNRPESAAIDTRLISGKLQGLEELESMGLKVPLFTGLPARFYKLYLKNPKKAVEEVKWFLKDSNIIKAMGGKIIIRSNFGNEDQAGGAATHGTYNSEVSSNTVDEIASAIEKSFKEGTLLKQTNAEPVIQSYSKGVVSGVAQIKVVSGNEYQTDFEFAIESALDSQGVTSGAAEKKQLNRFNFTLRKDGTFKLSGGQGERGYLSSTKAKAIAENLSKVTRHLIKTGRLSGDYWQNQIGFKYDLEWLVDSSLNVQFLQLRDSAPTTKSYRPDIADKFDIPQEVMSKASIVIQRKVGRLELWEAYFSENGNIGRYDEAKTIGVIDAGKVIKYNEIKSENRGFQHHGIWETNITIRDGRNIRVKPQDVSDRSIIHIYSKEQLLYFVTATGPIFKLENLSAIIHLEGRESIRVK